jgi:lipid-A-disaccharide synthase
METEIKTPARVFVSACEASADVHCANVIKAVKSRGYDIEFIGVGGDRMAQAGCKLLENTVARAAMTYKAISEVGFFAEVLGRIKSCLSSERIDLVMVCDSPSFNFHVAKAAKKRQIPTFFYVAPQLWAWAGWRIGKLRRCCDQLACILPFEEKYFTKRGVNAQFVGNPLLARLSDTLPEKGREYADFSPERASIALIPGSRKAEIESLWQPMQQIAQRLSQKWPGIHFEAVAVSESVREQLIEKQLEGFPVRYSIASVHQTALQTDFALVTSGSATVEVGSAGCPMLIMYQTNRLLWHLAGRWLVRTKYLSLINILAGTEMVPEFMPYFTKIDPLYETACDLLADPNQLRQVSSKLIELVKPLAKTNASEKVAHMLIRMLS